MNREQLTTVQTLGSKTQTICADDLAHSLDRTLLVGSMASGHGIHVYLKDNRIHRLVHAHDGSMMGHANPLIWPVGELCQGHSFRPEWADFDFVCRVVSKGAWFHWLGFVDSLYRQSWHRDFQAPIKEDF